MALLPPVSIKSIHASTSITHVPSLLFTWKAVFPQTVPFPWDSNVSRTEVTLIQQMEETFGWKRPHPSALQGVHLPHSVRKLHSQRHHTRVWKYLLSVLGTARKSKHGWWGWLQRWPSPAKSPWRYRKLGLTTA